jgi:hypothetical protein
MFADSSKFTFEVEDALLVQAQVDEQVRVLAHEVSDALEHIVSVQLLVDRVELTPPSVHDRLLFLGQAGKAFHVPRMVVVGVVGVVLPVAFSLSGR